MSKKGTKPHETYILCLNKQKKGVYFRMLNEDIEKDFTRMVSPKAQKGSVVLTGIRQGVPKYVIRKTAFLTLVMILILGILPAAQAESTGFRPGDWAFNHEPEKSVLLLREDGTAVWQGQECAWQDDGGYLHLKPEDGEEITIRYQATAEKTLVWLPAEYVRAEGVPGEGLAGAWIGKESEGSTFIFRESDHMFLEDGTFTGTFTEDPEAGTLLLAYIQYFDDTLCYFRLEGNDVLKMEYPWPLVETQQTPSAP